MKNVKREVGANLTEVKCKRIDPHYESGCNFEYKKLGAKNTIFVTNTSNLQIYN